MTTASAANDQAAPEAATPSVSKRSPVPSEMRVSSSSNPQSLACAVSHAIYDGRTVTLRAIGHGAVGQAMKAVAIARGFVAPRGFDIAVIPGWANVIGDSGVEVSAMTFRVVQLN